MSEENTRAEAVRFWWNKAIEDVTAVPNWMLGHIPLPSIVPIMLYSTQSVLSCWKRGVNSVSTVGSGPRLERITF